MAVVTKIIKHTIKANTKIQNYTTKKLIEMLLFKDSKEQIERLA